VSADWFVGRGGELDVLRELLTAVKAGVGGAVLVEGEQGIGKTALLRQGLSAAAENCTLAWATADELGQRFPLGLRNRCPRLRARPHFLDQNRQQPVPPEPQHVPQPTILLSPPDTRHRSVVVRHELPVVSGRPDTQNLHRIVLADVIKRLRCHPPIPIERGLAATAARSGRNVQRPAQADLRTADGARNRCQQTRVCAIRRCNYAQLSNRNRGAQIRLDRCSVVVVIPVVGTVPERTIWAPLAWLSGRSHATARGLGYPLALRSRQTKQINARRSADGRLPQYQGPMDRFSPSIASTANLLSRATFQELRESIE
jgi:hypothetical protein